MKIFNWVHRRFTHKDGLAENAKKSGSINAEESTPQDKQLVPENNAFPNVFDGWKGGILTIGTFGYDPLLKDETAQNDASFYPQEPEINENECHFDSEEEDEEEDEEANPLVLAAYEHDYEGLLGMKTYGNRATTKDEFEFDASTAKKERITLAELFSADSADLRKKERINKGEIMIKENKSNYKHGFSFTKKLIGDQDARPIHKLHRLMRRMLKRKIHPDVGVNKRNPVNGSKVVPKKCEAITESASLLSAQAAVADAII